MKQLYAAVRQKNGSTLLITSSEPRGHEPIEDVAKAFLDAGVQKESVEALVSRTEKLKKSRLAKFEALRKAVGDDDMFVDIVSGKAILWVGAKTSGVLKRHSTRGHGGRYVPKPEPVSDREPALLFTKHGGVGNPLGGKSAPVDDGTNGLKPTDASSPGDGDVIPDGDFAAMLAAYQEQVRTQALAEIEATRRRIAEYANTSAAETTQRTEPSFKDRLREALGVAPEPVRAEPSEFQKQRPKGETLAERNVRKAKDGLLELLGSESCAANLSQAGWYVSRKGAQPVLASTNNASPINGSQADAIEAAGWDVLPKSDENYLYLERIS